MSFFELKPLVATQVLVMYANVLLIAWHISKTVLWGPSVLFPTCYELDYRSEHYILKLFGGVAITSAFVMRYVYKCSVQK